MRSDDVCLAHAVINHWEGHPEPNVTICALLADRAAFLRFLEERRVRPGDALWPCPVCGENHRWTVLKTLIRAALDMQPERSTLMEEVDRAQDVLREMYGGDEGLREYRKAADEYFAKNGAGKCYKL